MSKAVALQIESRLHYLWKEGDRDLVDTYERVMRDRDVARYEQSVVANARETAMNSRRMFAAALLSTPTGEIRITRAALALVGGPVSDFVIHEYEDFATNTLVYSIHSRGEKSKAGVG